MMGDTYDVKLHNKDTGSWVAYNTRTGNVISKPVRSGLAREIAKSFQESCVHSLMKGMDGSASDAVLESGLNAEIRELSKTKVYVYSSLTTDEVEGMLEEGVRDWDMVDLAQPRASGASMQASFALLKGMDDLFEDIREREHDLILDLHDGEELLPTVLDQLLLERMASVRWCDEKDNPVNGDCPVKRRLIEFGENVGEPYGLPRYVAYLEMKNPDKPAEFVVEGIVVVEELEVDDGG